jgi:hypothetical protein
VSFLYFLKWAEYVALLYLIPGLIEERRVPALMRAFRWSLAAGAVASCAFAVYEVSESVRTHTYSQAALYPRASSFFGTLDPKRFGASEDPVNFGCYLMIAGAVSLALSGRGKGGSRATLSAAASFLGVLLSVSRAPILGAAVAYTRLQKLRAGRTLLSLAALMAAAIVAAVLFPGVTQTVVDRFSMVVPNVDSLEGSATDRLRIVLNSPVFEIDAYWLAGHGHSSYRFVSEQHLSSFINRVSRSLYNFPMTVWYDAGLAGLCLWTAFCFQLGRIFHRAANQRHDPQVAAFASGLRAALWALVVASMFSEVPYNWRVMGFFYNATGVFLALEGAAHSAARRNLVHSSLAWPPQSVKREYAGR